MGRTVFIVQGEGKGHMSQALAAKTHLERTGYSVEAVLLGTGSPGAVPGYFMDSFSEKLHTFRSPWLIRTPNKKGIDVGRTLLCQLFFIPLYLREIRRIRKMIRAIGPDVVLNFYDLVGSFAMRKLNRPVYRIGVGHHFYLHLDGYRCNSGKLLYRMLLSWHTRLILKSCDRVMALSYRAGKSRSDISVIPPLIRDEFLSMNYRQGDRYLVYLLSEGFLYDLIILAREDPGFRADIFTSLKTGIEIPEGIKLYPYSSHTFREKMASCRGLITTAGFDTAAEAACLGVPLAVIPSRHHFEQQCNGSDIERTGIGVTGERIDRALLQKMHIFDNAVYRKWVNRAGELFLNNLKES